MENVPAKIQHLMLVLSARFNQKTEPTLDSDTNTWSIKLEEELECNDMLHNLLADESGKSYDHCTAGQHNLKIEWEFRQVGGKSARRWKSRAYVLIDNFNWNIDPNLIMSLLSKPTNPQGEGKARGESAGSNKQAASIKKAAVMRN